MWIALAGSGVLVGVGSASEMGWRVGFCGVGSGEGERGWEGGMGRGEVRYLFVGDGLCLRQHGPHDALVAARRGQRAGVAVVAGSGG